MLAFEPPRRFVISWDLSPTWQLEIDASRASEVEVTFTPEAPAGRASSWSTATSSTSALSGVQ